MAGTALTTIAFALMPQMDAATPVWLQSAYLLLGAGIGLSMQVERKLSRSPGFEGRPERGEIEAALQRIAHRALIDRDWSANEAEFAGTAHGDGKAD